MIDRGDIPNYKQLRIVKRKAKKRHDCYLCQKPITVGEIYIYIYGIEDGNSVEMKYHQLCDLKMRVGDI
jgi:hypothetical protein